MLSRRLPSGRRCFPTAELRLCLGEAAARHRARRQPSNSGVPLRAALRPLGAMIHGKRGRQNCRKRVSLLQTLASPTNNGLVLFRPRRRSSREVSELRRVTNNWTLLWCLGVCVRVRELVCVVHKENLQGPGITSH